MRIKLGDHQILGNVIEAHQSLRFLGHLFWFDQRVLVAKIKIRLLIFTHKLQFALYVTPEFRIQGTCIRIALLSCNGSSRSKIFPLFT